MKGRKKEFEETKQASEPESNTSDMLDLSDQDFFKK